MPNGRRRRFSVQHNIIQRNQNKLQNGSQQSQQNSEKSKDSAPITKGPEYKQGSNSKNASPENDNQKKGNVNTITKRESVDKDVTASSSNIDLYNVLKRSDETGEVSQEVINGPVKENNKEMRQTTTREKYPRQHRVKVRSPKRRAVPAESKSGQVSVALNAIDWDQEVDIDHGNVVPAENANQDRNSTHSMDDMCRICHGGEALSPELGQMISACACRGTVGRVHVRCLERWLTESGKSRCELCGTRYATRRVHRYGLPKSLVMWLLSQNAKQLMVDSLGLMLMSPLAVLAAWLSGRTLSGLMTPDTHVTPWPLASTFVLACMTLVCYYCWIVSAATRHALGWWIWYRSQYEVRLQLQENEE